MKKILISCWNCIYVEWFAWERVESVLSVPWVDWFFFSDSMSRGIECSHKIKTIHLIQVNEITSSSSKDEKNKFYKLIFSRCSQKCESRKLFSISWTEVPKGKFVQMLWLVHNVMMPKSLSRLLDHRDTSSICHRANPPSLGLQTVDFIRH